MDSCLWRVSLSSLGLTALVACGGVVNLGRLSTTGVDSETSGEAAAICGDGVVQSGEGCDEGAENSAQGVCTPECQTAVCGDGYLLSSVEACDDGNLVEGDSCTARCEFPSAPGEISLQLHFAAIKKFEFTWAAVRGATYYQLMERITEDGAFAPVGGDIFGESLTLTTPLHLRLGASYILRACGVGGCKDSAPVGVVESMVAAVGYFKASNAEGDDLLGSGVALSADGDTLAVTAPGEDSAATGIGGDQVDNAMTDAGAVYIFARGNGVWSQQAYIKASNAQEGDQFGARMALSADGNTLVVGAPREASASIGVGGDQADSSAPGAGAVYVFERMDGAWSQQAYIKASNTASEDGFGSSLALSGDGGTIAVGAHQEDSAATGIGGAQDDNAAAQSGAVYVFVRGNSTWSQQAYIKASNSEIGDRFGRTVALSADGDTLAVSAPQEDSATTGVGGDQADNTATDAGAVYVFSRVDAVWSQEAYLKASNTGVTTGYGNAMALSADGDTLAVGSPREDSAAIGVDGDQSNNAAPDSGAVYVFNRFGGAWSQKAYVKASNTGAGDGFGSSVALSADGHILAVSAPQEDSSAAGIGGDEVDNSSTNTGAVYVLQRTNGAWSQRSYVKAANPGADDDFGIGVTLSADGSTLAVGAPGEASSATGVGGDQISDAAPRSGAVYVY